MIAWPKLELIHKKLLDFNLKESVLMSYFFLWLWVASLIHIKSYGNNLHKIFSENKTWNLPFHENQGFQKFYGRNWAYVSGMHPTTFRAEKTDQTIKVKKTKNHPIPIFLTTFAHFFCEP